MEEQQGEQQQFARMARLEAVPHEQPAEAADAEQIASALGRIADAERREALSLPACEWKDELLADAERLAGVARSLFPELRPAASARLTG